MIESYSIEELVRLSGDGEISRVVLEDEAEESGAGREALMRRMLDTYRVMKESAEAGFAEKLRSMSGMSGGNAFRYRRGVEEGKTFGGSALGRASARALAVAELNASMGRIVAAPTAGSCGVVPGLLITAQEQRGFSDEQLALALFTAAGVGRVIAGRASISGAEGGCQAEIGAAAAMGAAALTELGGGTPAACAAAVSMALMSLMGLVCDPVGGLVEVPCVYRNATGVAVAMTAADMALSGVGAFLPADEVIDAMSRVGRMMPAALRETGEGGCASCPSARAPQ